MAERPQTGAIRRPSKVSPSLLIGAGGCLLGAVIVIGGLWLAERQETALHRREAAVLRDRKLLTQALTEANLTAPRLRLEELAALPLVPELLGLAGDRQASLEARELKHYLQTVLDATLLETGLSRIALEMPDGSAVISADRPAASVSGTDTPQIDAVVFSLDDPDRPAGRLTGYVPNTKLAVLPPRDTAGSTLTASTDFSTQREEQQSVAISNTTRLLAALAGGAVTLFGLFSALLLRERTPDRS